MQSSSRARVRMHVPGWAGRLAGLAVLLLCASYCPADTLYVRSEAGGRPLAYNNVRVTRIAKGDSAEDVYYLLPGGDERNKPLEQIAQMTIDGELGFNAAEAAFAAGDMKAAAAGYRKAATSNKAWLKRRAESRLLLAAAKSGEFIDAVDVFVAPVQKDPTSAAGGKPTIAGASAPDLDSATAKIRKAADGGTSDQKQILLPFLAELYSAKKDTTSAQRTLAELTRLNPVAANNADVQKARGDVAIGQARDALSAKNYQSVLDTIRANAALFSDPSQQADALFMLAEAKYATASDDAALKDAGLTYMRVVANFKSALGAPHVADALFKTGQIEEKLKDTKAAVVIYTQLAADYKDTPAAKGAQERISQLGPQAK